MNGNWDDLFDRAMHGDDLYAFGKLIGHPESLEHIRNGAMSQLRSESMIDDAVQSACLNLLRRFRPENFEGQRGGQSFKRYLKQAGRNAAVDAVRKEKDHELLDEHFHQLQAPFDMAEWVVWKTAFRNAWRECAGTLTLPNYKLYWLAKQEGLSYDMIEDFLRAEGESFEPRSKARAVQRAQKKIMDCLKRKGVVRQ